MAAPRRRVVVTGLGLVTPLGVGVEDVWRRILARETGVTTLGPAFAGLPCAVAAPVPRADSGGGGDGSDSRARFAEREWVDASQARSVAPFTAFALSAAQQALDDAALPASAGRAADGGSRDRWGVAFGSGIGSMDDIVEAAAALAARGHRRVSPFFVPRTLINLAAGQLALRHGLRGPCHSAATACATGGHSVGDAFRMIAYGDADVMVAGAAEAAITPLAIAGFCRLNALSTAFNEQPARASRPFDSERDGFVMGEGAGALILESYEHALARGVGSARGGGGGGVDGASGPAATPGQAAGAGRIYAEIVGYGMSCDAFHVTSPPLDGDGALRCMRAALADARLRPRDVGYVNAHATSTPKGDEIELRALRALFSGAEFAAAGAARRVAVSSTKGATGHLLGAAGAVEAAFAVLAVRARVAPPTINLERPVEPAALEGEPAASPPADSPLELVTAARALGGEGPCVALTNSFGFGGTNASLVFRSFEP